MKLIILSGGSGTRLWPLSRDHISKQFLHVLHDKDGQSESMLQRMYGQIIDMGLLDETFICTVDEQVEILKEQLNAKFNLDEEYLKQKIIVEPYGRDTFGAIALSALYLYKNYNIDPNEVIAVLPVDLYIDSLFFEALDQATKLVDRSQFDLVMIGVQPTYPADKYGYIVPEEVLDEGYPCYSIKSFVEKPDQFYARSLITQEAFWNSGFFSFKLQFLLQYLENAKLSDSYELFRQNYHLLPKQSFDYEVAEFVTNAALVPHHGIWNDMGTWDTLTEFMQQPIDGNGKIGEGCTNVHVINKLEQEIMLSGFCNLVIIACPGGILIADKKLSSNLKKYINSMTKDQFAQNINTYDCSNVSVENNSGRRVLVIGMMDAEIICDNSKIIIQSLISSS